MMATFIDKWIGAYCGILASLMLWNINQFASGFMACMAFVLTVRNLEE